MDWRAEAQEAGLTDRQVERVAKAIYLANWRELPGGRFPLVWEVSSDAVREFTRNQAVRAILASRTF